uniref:Peptidase S1 domain-containing protein n=1 Tax=Caenorhabditis tropicalis TaxID=1561998 RepID=A0A1I7T633_9PELO
MVSYFPFFVAVLAIQLTLYSNAFKLSIEENEALQETCGTNMKEVDRYTRKVLNGAVARSGESPWTVAIVTSDPWGNSTYSTGALFSSKHIISYDKLFLIKTRDGFKYLSDMKPVNMSHCVGPDLVLPRHITRQVFVFTDVLDATRLSENQELQVSSVRILDWCNRSDNLNHVAVIELIRTIEKNNKVRPICLGSDARPSSALTFYGFGDNRGEVIDAKLRHTEVTEVPCKNPSDNYFCVQSQQPLCNGDFGGVAVKKIDGAIRAFGVYLKGPYECAKAKKDTVYTFANLAGMAGHICEEIGICSGSLYKTTMSPLVGDDEQTSLTQSSGLATSNTGGVTHDGGFSPPDHESNTASSVSKCIHEPEDNDIHIHIKLGKFAKTGNEKDIEIVRQGPRKLSKRSQ